MKSEDVYKFLRVVSGCLFAVLEIMREYRKIKKLEVKEKEEEKKPKNDKTND